MTLSEIKTAILEDTLSDDLIVFVWDKTNFIVKQYIDEICSRTGKAVNKIQSIFEPQQSNLSIVFDFTSKLNVLEVEEFDELAEDYYDFKNTIVSCNKINSKIKTAVAPFTVAVPQAPEWAMKDYLHTICPVLSSEEIDWLYAVTEGDEYRCVNELDKIRAFPESEQKYIFNELRFARNTDLCTTIVYPLTNAIIAKDYGKMYDWLLHNLDTDTDPVGMTSLLLKDFKQAAFALGGATKTLEEMKVSSGRVYHIKQNFAQYNLTTIRKCIDFLSGIDLRLKNNQLDMSKPVFITYVVSKMMELGAS